MNKDLDWNLPAPVEKSRRARPKAKLSIACEKSAMIHFRAQRSTL